MNGDMMKKHFFRTDLAVELLDTSKKKRTIKEETIDGIKVTDIKLGKMDGKKIGKKPGHYITLEFDDITNYDIKLSLVKVLSNYLSKLIKDKHKVLIIGLGNEKSTADALGPLSLKHVIVNSYLIDMGVLDSSVRTYAFAPSVMGETGIETSDLIKTLTKLINPDLVIAIDALASSSIERLNHTIQINDTGIEPGSGIGNKRKEITKEAIGVDVVAIGVPTVVDAATIVGDTIDYMYKYFSYTKESVNDPANKLKTGIPNYKKHKNKISLEERKKLLGMLGDLNNEEVKSLMLEVLSPINSNLMVTPKEIDFVIRDLAEVIGNAINYAINPNVTNYLN